MFWNNIGLTKKMAAFAGIMLVIIAILTVLFMTTINLLSGESRRVGSTGALSELMLAREIDHLNWITVLQRYVLDSEVKELSIQTDPYKCGLGTWFYGEGREAAEAEFPVLAEKLKKLDAPHAALHASAADIAKLKTAGSLGEAKNVFLTVSLPSVQAVQGILKEVTDLLNAEQDASNVSFEASVVSSRNQTLLLVGVGLVIALIMSVVMAKTVTAPMQRLAQFADKVASGDFTAAISMRRGDELGNLAASLQRIPEVLNNIMGEAGKLVEHIQAGGFRRRIDSKGFSGGFNDLTISVNAVSDAYTKLLDVIPLPIMSCDLDMNITYLNNTAQAAVGGDKVGDKCSGHLKATICNTPDCCGKIATASCNALDCETAIEPCGQRLDVKVTAVPMLDATGKAVGFIELLSDLTDIKNTQRRIQHAAAEAAEITNRVAAASEELSAQVEQVSRGADMQRSRVESTASAMSEMNSTVLEVARNASEASEQSELTKNKANDGSSLVSNVVKAISTVETTAAAMQVSIQELGQQAESIGGVMNVISDIADQTNLLALNAAIEAARAGEAGRGFAVVADEVRKLAEKTMTATHEVGGNISAIQDSTHQSISAMNAAISAVQEATELAGQSGQALGEIVDLAATTSSAVFSIATAAEEQSATSEEINGAVEEINHVVGETSEGMVQASAAVQELSRMAQELNRVMEQLKDE